MPYNVPVKEDHIPRHKYQRDYFVSRFEYICESYVRSEAREQKIVCLLESLLKRKVPMCYINNLSPIEVEMMIVQIIEFGCNNIQQMLLAETPVSRVDIQQMLLAETPVSRVDIQQMLLAETPVSRVDILHYIYDYKISRNYILPLIVTFKNTKECIRMINFIRCKAIERNDVEYLRYIVLEALSSISMIPELRKALESIIQ